AVGEQLGRGETRSALRQLNVQGRIHEVVDRHDRLRAIAADYVRSSSQTLVVSPDNQSRQEINTAIHQVREDMGQVDRRRHSVQVLVARQDITGADRAWARHY